MAMVNVVIITAYKRIYNWLKLIDLVQRHCVPTFVRWTGWTLAVAVHCYNDNTINIVVAVTILLAIIRFNSFVNDTQFTMHMIVLKKAQDFW